MTATVETRRVVSASEALGEVHATDPLSVIGASSAELGDLGVLSLELDRGEVPQRGVPAAWVAPALDVLEDRGARGGSGGPGLPVGLSPS